MPPQLKVLFLIKIKEKILFRATKAKAKQLENNEDSRERFRLRQINLVRYFPVGRTIFQ